MCSYFSFKIHFVALSSSLIKIVASRPLLDVVDTQPGVPAATAWQKISSVYGNWPFTVVHISRQDCCWNADFSWSTRISSTKKVNQLREIFQKFVQDFVVFQANTTFWGQLWRSIGELDSQICNLRFRFSKTDFQFFELRQLNLLQWYVMS